MRKMLQQIKTTISILIPSYLFFNLLFAFFPRSAFREFLLPSVTVYMLMIGISFIPLFFLFVVLPLFAFFVLFLSGALLISFVKQSKIVYSRKIFNLLLQIIGIIFCFFFIFVFSFDLCIFPKFFLFSYSTFLFVTMVFTISSSPKKRFFFIILSLLIIVFFSKFYAPPLLVSYYFYCFFIVFWHYLKIDKFLIKIENSIVLFIKAKGFIGSLFLPSLFVIIHVIYPTFDPYYPPSTSPPHARRIISPKLPIYGFSIMHNTIYAVGWDTMYKINVKNLKIQKIKIKHVSNIDMERVKVQNGKVYASINADTSMAIFTENPFKLNNLLESKNFVKNIAIDGNSIDEIYSFSELGNTLWITDSKNLRTKNKIPLPCFLPSPYDVEYYLFQNKLFVTNWQTCPYIVEIDLKHKKTKKHFAGFSQTNIKIKDNLLYVARPLIGRVDIYSLPTMKMKMKIWLEGGIRSFDVIDNKYIAAGNFFSGNLYIADIRKQKIEKTIRLCTGIREVGYNNLNNRLYISSSCGLWEIEVAKILYKKF